MYKETWRRVWTIAAIFALPFTGISYTHAGDEDDDEEIEWDEAELFFELNNSDGDLGIHASVDGGPWKSLAIEDLNERPVLKIKTGGSLRQQGMTQLEWEVPNQLSTN